MATDYFAGDPRTNRERMLAGDLYIADDPESGRIAQRAVELLEQYRLASIAGDPDAGRILADVLGQVGEDVVIKPPLMSITGRTSASAPGRS